MNYKEMFKLCAKGQIMHSAQRYQNDIFSTDVIRDFRYANIVFYI